MKNPTNKIQRLRNIVVALFLALGTAVGGIAFASPANAATYPIVNVQAGANARYNTCVTCNSVAGKVIGDAWPNNNTQRSWVACYQDGDWATGNYYTNRWFKVYVSIGREFPGWYFVHASYVYDQKPVGRC